MVSRRNTGRADKHADTGEENSGTTPEVDNPMLQQIIQRMDQLQEQNQTLQQQNQALQMQCKLFSETLSGATLIWFSHLPPLSISGIQDLLKKFLAQFSARRSRMMTSGKLFSIRQKAFQQPTRTKNNYDGRGQNFQPRTNWDDRRKAEQIESQGLDSLTPLNTSRARILKEVYQSDLIRLPLQAKGPKGPDLNKWWDYHRARGHDTEDCWTLTNRIERLINEGYLGKYVEKRKDRGDKDQRREEGG
ncbi:hypothetical protein SESBI_03126 [Sesbania bispinosa]|nr:hypothetical protein SESBI_03126 [Sesbania bispinosa]